MENGKSRIGLVVANIDTGWALNVCPSFIKIALKEDKSLFIFPGGRLNAPINSEYLRNPVFSLVNEKNLDGLIIWSSSIKFTESDEDFKHFHCKFDPLPYVTLAYKIPGHPCVEFDGYSGVKQLINHCIEVHGARKIAFLQGPAFHPQAQERLLAYRDALKEAGLPAIPDDPLVTDPFNWSRGDEAAAQLFESRNLKPGKDFDTIVGSSDFMTVGAMNYFSRLGYQVPRDYRALGFNNSMESQIAECPLSTVQPPLTELSSESFRLLLKLLDKEGGIEDIHLHSKPVIRESCGCTDSYFLPVEADSPRMVKQINHPEETLTALITNYFHLDAGEADEMARPLVRAWNVISREDETSAISAQALEIFFDNLKDALHYFFNSGNDREILLNFLKELPYSGFVPASLIRRLEPAILRTIFRIREQLAVHEQYIKESWNRELNSLKCELLGTKSRISLIQSLAQHLPKIGIENAGLALYSDDATSLWVGSFSPQGISPLQEQSFPKELLIPEPLGEQFSRGIFMVQPLFIDNSSLGHFIHSVRNYDGLMIEELRSTISYALKGIFQFEEVVRVQQKIQEVNEQSRVLILQQEAAQAASDAKSQFLANVSHEIRTPMNAVLGMAELLLAESLNKRQRRYVEDIKTSAMALLEIINQILDLSKIQSGKMSLIPIHYDFHALVDNIESMIRFLIKNRDLAFQIERRGNVPRYLYGDDVRLRQILLNLLGNAVKFTNTGYVHLTIAVSDSDIHFIIRDTGIGIRAEDIPKLFEPFRQTDELKNRGIKGTGLGLSITKALVEMMNGKIDMESEYGKGTVFNITIPKILGNEKQLLRSGPDERFVCSLDTKILVVDDNAINLNVVSGLLQLYNISAVTASSGRQALEKVGKDKYDIVFMDHMMPEMDGVETAEKIRKLGITVPIIALTANAVTSAKEMLLAAGMDDFLSKPIVKEELNKILAKWIPETKRIRQQDEEIADESGGIAPETRGDHWDKLKNIEGLSVQLGLERVSGQTDIYENALKLLIKEIEKCTEKLNSFLGSNDMHSFTIETHSMKTSLANLGAMELSSKAHDLEVASAHMDAALCASALQPFIGELRVLGDKIADAFPELHGESGPVVVPPELALILTRMKEACGNTEFEEINNELKNLETFNLEGELKNDIEEIKDAVMVMDYDSAIEVIHDLLHDV